VKASLQETLNQVHPNLPRQPSLPLSMLTGQARLRLPGVLITQRNTPALFGDGLIDAIPDDAIINQERGHSTTARLVGFSGARDSRVRGRVSRLSDGRIGRFGWKLEFATLGDFVKAACANELGLSNPGRPQAAPLSDPKRRGEGVDLTDEQCSLMADFIRGLPAPLEVVPQAPEPAGEVRSGRTVFRAIGCADCHAESLGTVTGLYSDLLLHDMGSDLEATIGYSGPGVPPMSVPDGKSEGSEQPAPGEWRTPPLWGVADSGPYLHDGRAATLEEAIHLHGGEAVDVTARFKTLEPRERSQLLAFLKTLKAPPADGPAATATSLAAR
jgi:CxxC motif-containing protein (DUF1111 family)